MLGGTERLPCAQAWGAQTVQKPLPSIEIVGAIIDRPPKNGVFRISRREIIIFSPSGDEFCWSKIRGRPLVAPTDHFFGTLSSPHFHKDTQNKKISVPAKKGVDNGAEACYYMGVNDNQSQTRDPPERMVPMEPRSKHFRKRDAILNYLRHTNEHPSAETVYAALKAEIPDLSLGTVYRNLSLRLRL